MADLFYIDENYYYPSQGYHVYIADAVVDLTVYIEYDYIEYDYYEDPQVTASWSASSTITSGQTLEAEAAFIVTAAQSTTATRVKEFAVAVDNLFTSSMTVVAQRAGVALLETQSTMTIAPVANRSATIALANLVNVSSQAQYTADVILALSTTATQTTEIQNAQLASAALSATSTVFTSKYFGSGRPRNLNETNLTLLFDTSIKKFGSASLYGTGNNVSDIIQAKNYGSIDIDSEDFAFESWIYRSSTTTHVASCGIGPIFVSTVSGNTNQISISYVDNANNTTTNTYTALNSSAWNHILVVKNSTTLAYYVNGSRVASLTPPAGFYQSIGYVSTFNFTPGNVTNTNRIDETSFHLGTTLGYTPSQTTITVPTSARTNDSVYTQALYHFDSSLVDDVSTTELALVALNATATVTAQANANTKLASASLSITATQSTAITAVKEATASITVAFTETIEGIRVRFADSSQNTLATQTAVIGSIKQFAVTVDSLFASSLDADAQLAGIALIETTSTMTVIAAKTAVAQSAQSAQFSQSASILYTAGGVSNQSAEFAQSTLGDRIRFGVASQSAEFTQSTTGNKLPPFSAVLASTATVTVNIDKIKLANSDLSTTVTQSAQAVKTTDVISAQSSSFAQSADNIRVRFALSTQNSQFAQTTQAVKTADSVTAMALEFTQSTQAVKTAVFTANNLVLFASSIDADLTARPLVYLESTASLTAIIGSIKQYVPNNITGVRPRTNATKSSAPYTLAVGAQFTASIWFRKNSLTDSSGPIWSTSTINSAGNLPAFARRFEYYGDTGLRYVYVSTGTANALYQPSWPNSLSNDTEWHHALIRVTTVGASERWDLWVDGVQKTPYTTSNIPVDHNLWAQNADDAVTGFKLGHTIPGNGETGVDVVLDGDLAQIWIGNIANNQFEPSLFYNDGAKDLGTTGTLGGQLPTPWLYNSLDTPYQNLINYSNPGSTINSATEVLPLPDLEANFRLTGSFIGVFLFVWNVESEFTQTATATRVLAGHADLATTATETAIVNGEFGGASNLTSTASLSATIAKTTGYQSALAAEADFAVQPGFFELASADLTDQFDLVADFDAVPPTRGEAALLAEFNITIDANSFTAAVVIHLGTFTQVCEATLIPPIRASADLTAQFTVSAVIGSIEQFAVLTASLGSLSALISVTKTTGAQFTATQALSATATRSRTSSVSLSALHSVLIAGDVQNLDPFLTLTITEETRVLSVKAESRTLIIEQETRSLIIEGWE